MPVLQVRITDEQDAELRARADAAGVKVSEYVRSIILDPEGAQDSDQASFRYAVADHERRMAELEAWHERSKQMRTEYERRGWQNPLENPDAQAMYFKRNLVEPIERDEDVPDFPDDVVFKPKPLPKIAPRR